MAKETNKEETVNTVPESITVTKTELAELVAAEVAKALAGQPKSAPVTKEDLAGLIDPHGRNYKSTAKLRTAKGGQVIREN